MVDVVSIEENRLAPSNLPIDIMLKKEVGQLLAVGEDVAKVKSKAKTKTENIAKPVKEKRGAFQSKKDEIKFKPSDFESLAEGGATEILTDVFIERLYLECVTPTGLRKIEIAAEEFIVGSSAEANAVIDFNPGISRKHCRIIYQNERYFVEDLGSANGTYLNKKRLSEDVEALKEGDRLQLANTLFIVKER